MVEFEDKQLKPMEEVIRVLIERGWHVVGIAHDVEFEGYGIVQVCSGTARVTLVKDGAEASE